MNTTMNIFLAAQTGNLEQVEKLLKEEVDGDSPDNFYKIVLRYATYSNYPALVKLLLDKGANVDTKFDGGWTVLMAAVNNRQIEVVRVFLAAGANPNIQASYGGTALMNAAQGGNEEIARMLLAAGADVNAKNLGGWSALMSAAVEGRSSTCRMLVEAGADVEPALYCFKTDEFRQEMLELSIWVRRRDLILMRASS